MPNFAVEQYLPGSTADERLAQVEIVRAARERLAELGARHCSSVTVPADEMCMHLFEAAREADLVVAYRHVRLRYDRIVEIEMYA